MTNFSILDSKFYKFGAVLGDMILVGFLWTIFSLPIITMGATTTALYYVCTKKSSGRDDYIFKSFLRSFKENFTKATAIFSILAGILYIVWINFYSLGQIDMGWLNRPITFALYFVLLQVIFVTTHVFCILSRFETSIFGALRSALFMAYRHILTTLSNLVLLVTIFTISILFPFLIIFNMGIYIYLSSFMFVKMFRKHYPDFDKTIELTPEYLN